VTQLEKRHHSIAEDSRRREIMTKTSGYERAVWKKICLIILALLFAQLISYTGAGQAYSQNKQDKQDIQDPSEKYDRAGRQIAAALNSGNAKNFALAIDKDALLDRVFDGMSQDEKRVKKIRGELYRALDQVGAVLNRNLGENGRLTFVRSRSIGSGHRALVRIDLGGQGLNYLDFILHVDKEGAIRIIDWHDYAQGQMYTDSVAQALVLLMPDEKSLIEKLLGKDNVDRKAAREMLELFKLARQQQYAEWLKKYNDSSDKIKHNRLTLITRTMISSAIKDNDQYRLALGDVHKYFGDDPTLSLVLLDYYFYEGDFRAAHMALDRLDKYTGGDAAIDGLRANIFLTEKKYPESISSARRAIEEDAGYEDAYWTLLDASVNAKLYHISVETIKKLEVDFGYTFNPEKLAKTEGYEEFAGSAAFAKWRDTR
jgi:tetratricopeptide (TPR) repeat protein